MRNYYLFILFLSCTFVLKAQTANFRQFNVEDGLLQSNVRDITQDQFGNLWLATQGGLSVFDGKDFRHYKKNDGLKSKNLYALLSDRDGNMLIGSAEGLFCFNGQSFNHFTFGNSVESEEIYGMSQSRDGTIWLATGRPGIHYFSLENEIKRFPITNSDSLWVSAISAFDDQTIIASYQHGLFSYNDGIVVPFLEEELPENEIIYGLYAAKSALWIATQSAVYRYQDDQLERFVEISEALGGREIYSIYVNEDEEAWLGTDQGVLLASKDGHMQYDERAGLSSNLIYKVFSDREGVMWFGTYGKGIYKTLGNTFKQLGKEQGLPFDYISTLIKDKDRLWLGTYGQGVFYKSDYDDEFYELSAPDQLNSNFIYDLAKTTDGKIWIGHSVGAAIFDDGSITKINAEEGLVGESVFVILEDANEQIYLGTDQGLNYYDGKSFEHWNVGSDDRTNRVRVLQFFDGGQKLAIGTKDGLFIKVGEEIDRFVGFDFKGYAINALHLDRNDNLWVGLANAGLVRLGLKSGEHNWYNEGTGLSSDITFNLVVDAENKLWVGSQIGLDQLSFDENWEIVDKRNFGFEEGFTGIETNTGAVFLEDSDKIWYGTIQGAFLLSPSNYKVNKLAPSVHLESIKLFNEEVDFSNYAENIEPWFGIPQDLELPYDQNHITFTFKSGSLRNPDKVFFRHRLRAEEKKWSPETRLNSVSYTNLNPGSYTFEVIACNNDGIWSDPLSFNFAIKPAFWQTTWFALSIFGLLILGLFVFNRYRVRSILNQALAIEAVKREESELVRKQVARDFHDEIGNQLASISMIVQLLKSKTKDSVAGDNYLMKLEKVVSQLFAGTKDFIWAIDPKSDKVWELCLYLKDFGEDLFDNSSADFLSDLSPIQGESRVFKGGNSRQIILIFKEAMTNVAKYANAQKVRLQFATRDEEIEIKLIDDGVGFEVNEVSRINGIENMEIRSGKIGAEFALSSEYGKGTEVKLIVKMI